MANFTNAPSVCPSGQDSLHSKRLEDGKRVPFLIRAWWLREFEESRDLDWYYDCVQPTLWSTYSDPLCDVGGVDDYDGT